MPRKKHPITSVLTFFRTQPLDSCQMALQVIKDEMAMRFTGLKVSGTPARPRKKKISSEPEQLELPFKE